MRYKVMLAEDDLNVAKMLEMCLEKAGYSVMHSYSGREVLDKIAKSRPDIILMDVLLGDADGKELCRLLRSNPLTKHIPIILMSGSMVAAEDVVRGLNFGADDYLSKPVDPRVLVAKIDAVLRRANAPEAFEEVLKRHGLQLNVLEHRVRLKGREIELTRMEFELLVTLLRSQGKVLSHRYLLETVWGYEPERYNDSATVQVHISRLRKKLGGDFGVRIENVLGVGYRIA